MQRSGTPLTISANSSGLAERPALHALPQGGFLAIWESYVGGGIVAQRFNARGLRAGEPFTLVPLVEGRVPNARSAVLSDGQLLIVWEEDGGLRAQRFDPRGGPVNDALQPGNHVNKELVDLTRMDGGGYALTLLVNPKLQGVNYLDWSAIHETTLFDSSGQAQGEAVRIGTDSTEWSVGRPQVAPYPSGGFVTIWQEQRRSSSFSSEPNTRLLWQRFGSDGASAGPAITVEESSWKNILLPHSIVSLANGRVVVLWSDWEADSCRTQLFASDGRKLGRQVVVEGVNLSQWNQPSVCALADGGFVATWEVADPGGAGRAIGGQRFDNRGGPMGERFLVNEPSWHYSQEITITPLVDGRFVVGWTDANTLTDSNPQLSRHWQIRGQILDGRSAPIQLKGTSGDDDYLGTAFADRMFGEAGNDVLAGGAGDDMLWGGSGDDRLIGGSGADRMSGGDGRDQFVFRRGSLAPGVIDRIIDFVSGGDRLNLRALDADATRAGNQSFSLMGPSPGEKIGFDGFTAPAQLRYARSSGILSGNVDAHPGADFEILLSNRPLLQGSDLIL